MKIFIQLNEESYQLRQLESLSDYYQEEVLIDKEGYITPTYNDFLSKEAISNFSIRELLYEDFK